MHYSVFFPNKQGANNAHFVAAGLPELANEGWDWIDSHHPDAGRGVLATRRHHLEELDPLRGLKPIDQHWVRSMPLPDRGTDAGAFWLVWDPKRPPRPSDLLRQQNFAGQEVPLNDGNLWLVPESLSLPGGVGRDLETGEVTRFYSAEFAEFCRQTEEFVYIFFQATVASQMAQKEDPGRSYEYELPEAWSYATKALSLNYRLADPICGMGFLNLLEEKHVIKTILATIKYPDIVQVIVSKKNDSPISIQI